MRKRAVITTVLVQILTLALWGVAQAAPLIPLATYTGGKAASADGIGSQGGVVDVETPANATVVQAFLYNITFGGEARGGTTTATIDTVSVGPMGFIGFENLIPGFDLSTYRTDVTSLVAPKVNANVAGGKTSFTLGGITGASGSTSDGVALVVVFSAPSIPSNQSVAILDGSQGGSAGPQTATFLLAGPLDKTVLNFKAVLGLGINFSSQNTLGHVCGAIITGQFSTADINATRLSSCAGASDDTGLIDSNGSLITIGGVDDSLDNPPPLCQDSSCNDDELYDISSFLKQGDTKIAMTTFNPSNDDALFVAVLQLTADILQTCTQDCIVVPPAVPAPATALLLGSGLVGLAVLRRTLFAK